MGFMLSNLHSEDIFTCLIWLTLLRLVTSHLHVTDSHMIPKSNLIAQGDTQLWQLKITNKIYIHKVINVK